MNALKHDLLYGTKNESINIECISPWNNELSGRVEKCDSLARAAELNHHRCARNALDKLVVENDQFALLKQQRCLYIAIDNESLETTKILLEKGFRPNTKLKYLQWHRVTPLHVACRNLSVKLMELLLEKGADINATDEKMETCLHYAIRYCKCR